MSRRVASKLPVTTQEIVAHPTFPGPRACDDHSFELPAGIH